MGFTLQCSHTLSISRYSLLSHGHIKLITMRKCYMHGRTEKQRWLGAAGGHARVRAIWCGPLESNAPPPSVSVRWQGDLGSARQAQEEAGGLEERAPVRGGLAKPHLTCLTRLLRVGPRLSYCGISCNSVIRSLEHTSNSAHRTQPGPDGCLRTAA